MRQIKERGKKGERMCLLKPKGKRAQRPFAAMQGDLDGEQPLSVLSAQLPDLTLMLKTTGYLYFFGFWAFFI